MIILKDISQINDRLNSIFDLNHTFTGNDFSFINDFYTEEKILQIIEGTIIISGKEEKIEELSLLIFQLKDYIPALCNLTNMFLLSKNYDAVFYFTSKLFISHIGTINYQTTGNLNYLERLFDRFIEIVKNCNISKENYIPFILEIFSSQRVGGLANWKKPALEYMKTFFNENEEWVTEFVQNNAKKLEMMNLLCLFNTQKGLSYAIEYYNNFDEDKFLNLFKTYKKETILYIDQKMKAASEETLAKFTNILLSMENDTDAKSRLEEIYKRSYDKNLRNTISQSIGIIETSSYKNEKQFLFAVRRNVKEPLVNISGYPFSKFNLKFSSGLELDNASYTYLIEIFKQDANILNLTKYLSLLEVFENNSLQEFINSIFTLTFYKQDLMTNNWAVRMVSVLSDKNMEEKLYDYLKMLFFEGRIKEGKYLLSCLILSKKDCFDLIKTLAISDNANFKPFLENFIEEYADFNKIDKEELKDQLVSENFDEAMENLQKQRLFESFISGKFYTKSYFEKLFINHALFNKLAQNLVFGEYKYGRLYNAFILEGKSKKFIVAKELEGHDSVVSIIHPLDCDMRFQSVYNHFDKPAFNQFEDVLYNVKDFSRSSVAINAFAGIMIDTADFYNNLKKYNFKINSEVNNVMFNSFVHIMPRVDIICELETERPISLSGSSTTLANIYFYHLNDVTLVDGKYITSKQKAIGIGSLPYRYFGYILTTIFNCIK